MSETVTDVKPPTRPTEMSPLRTRLTHGNHGLTEIYCTGCDASMAADGDPLIHRADCALFGK